MRREPLGNGIEIYVSDSHHFTTDTILLADFARVKDRERAVDLGTGCGTIPLLTVRRSLPEVFCAIDIQKEAIELLRESIAYNIGKGSARVNVIQPIVGDLREIRGLLPAGEYDVVICNPPYKLPGSGIESPDAAKKTARHEVDCTLDDVMKAASRLLRFGGRFAMCQRPERLTDVLSQLRANGMEPKRLRMVQGRADKAPKLFLVEAKRGAKPGYMDVMPALIVEDAGGFTPEMREIYGDYKEGHDNG